MVNPSALMGPTNSTVLVITMEQLSKYVEPQTIYYITHARRIYHFNSHHQINDKHQLSVFRVVKSGTPIYALCVTAMMGNHPAIKLVPLHLVAR